MAIKQIALCHMSKYDQYTAIYTDGSKEQGKTACAFVTDDQITAYRLADESEIVEAELQAIVMACQYLTDRPEIKKQSYIQTHSLHLTYSIALNSTTIERTPTLYSKAMNVYSRAVLR